MEKKVNFFYQEGGYARSQRAKARTQFIDEKTTKENKAFQEL